MDDDMVGYCDDYQGAVYSVSGDDIPFVHPDGCVALTTVTYLQGVGLNMRTVNIPGSDPAMFFEETEDYGVCQCSPPAMWVFTAIDTDGGVHTYHTLSGHEAVHMLRHPDHLFQDAGTSGIQENGLALVPAEFGLEMVTQELVDYLSGLGVPSLKDEGGLSFRDVSDVDVDELLSMFFEKGENE